MKTGKEQGAISFTRVLALWSLSAVAALPVTSVLPMTEYSASIISSAEPIELQMLSALPLFLVIPSILVSGYLSIFIDRRRILFTGLAMLLSCGIIHLSTYSLAWSLTAACSFGIGAGLTIPLSTGFIATNFRGKYLVKQMGFASAINSSTPMIVALFMSYVPSLSDDYYLTVLIVPAVTVVLLATAPLKQSADFSQPCAPDRTRIKAVAMLSLLYFFISYSVLDSLFHLPALLGEYGISQSLAGAITAVFFMSIVIPSLFLRSTLNHFGENTIFISLLMMAVGFLFISLFNQRIPIFFGYMAAGWGFGIMQPLVYAKAVHAASQRFVTSALSFVMVASYAAIVSCTSIAGAIKFVFFSESDALPVLFNAVLMLVLASIAYVNKRGFTLGVRHEFYS